MAKLGINTGIVPDDGNGDSLLDGAIKINSNFDEIYTYLGDGTNLTFTAFSGDYGDLTNTPLNLSDFNNDVGFVTSLGGGGGESYWSETSAGIHTLSNVGIGTTNPISTLTVVGSGTSTSQLYVTGVSTFINNIEIGTLFSTNNQIRLGESGNLIYDRPSITLSTNYSSGKVRLKGQSGADILGGNNQLLASFNGNPGNIGYVELYHQGFKKFETIGAGVTVTGITFTNGLSVSGVSTFSGTANFTGPTNLSTTIGTNLILSSNITIGAFTPGIGAVILNNGTYRSRVDDISFGIPIPALTIGRFQNLDSLNLYNNGDIETIGNISVGFGGTVITTTTSGLVGIGTTNPGSKLTIFGDILTGNPNDSSSQFKVNTVGDVSISPGRLLYLNGNSTNVGIRWTNTLGIELYNSSNIGGNDRDIQISSNNGGTVSLKSLNNTLSINSSGTAISGIATVTGTTFTNQLSVSGVSTIGDIRVSSGIVTASSSGIVTYYGDASNTTDGRWTLGASGSSNYTFTGIGFTQTTDDPILYLARGRVYEFVNNSGGSHPFEIRISNGGAAYNDGITNNGAATGVIRFEVPFNAPNTLYYQCTVHSGMGNTISVYPSAI